MAKIGVIGAGAWGTALAQLSCDGGSEVVIQAHEPEVVEAINSSHENPVYLPGITLDPSVRAVADPAEAAEADIVLLAVPAQHLRAVASRASPALRPSVPAIICAKGIEAGTGALMSEVVADILPAATVAVLSGPSFATEVARGLPTALTFACTDPDVRAAVPVRIGTPRFRLYSTADVVGAEIGGAVKNVLAIACGIVTGRNLGDNARAALVTRGLAEIARLAGAKGARPETVMGLSGLGDLVLTCNAMQSRNFSLGVALGEGISLADILAARKSVAEGVHTAASVVALADQLGIEMPISAAVDAVLNRGADLDATIAGLLARPFRAEGR